MFMLMLMCLIPSVVALIHYWLSNVITSFAFTRK